MLITAAIRSLFGPWAGCDPEPVQRDLPVADFPSLAYSKKDVLRAGEALKGDLLWTDETSANVLQVFQIANSWRDSHALPMNRLRAELSAKIQARGLGGVTVARLKRMPSIRRKLQRLPYGLNQIQDLGGCRAILPSIKDAVALAEQQRTKSKHAFEKEDNYIAQPKKDGYRCDHLIFRFCGKGEVAPFDGRRIELQIRTRLQHSWATAVEAIGLFRKEDLKSGVGSAEWLRLFELMSTEFAATEKCPEPSTLSPRARRYQLKELEQQLDAINTLETLRQTVRYRQDAVTYPYDTRPRYYRIIYDHNNKMVSVEPFDRAITGTASYGAAEIKISKEVGVNFTTVLVEADTVDSLRDAYPNYFGDVTLFVRNLRLIAKGHSAEEYTMPAKQTVRPSPPEKPDMSWFRRRGRWN